jgi:hypothetical protein
MAEAMIRAATEADAEAIYELLFAARGEIPLSTIATDPREDWHAGIREWCAYGRSLVAEPDGEVVSVIIVVPPVHIGEVPPPDGWTLRDHPQRLSEGPV